MGRITESAVLDEEIAQVGAGTLRVVLVERAAGVGKTRLADAALARHADRVGTLAARSYRLGATSSFGHWMEALDRHLPPGTGTT